METTSGQSALQLLEEVWGQHIGNIVDARLNYDLGSEADLQHRIISALETMASKSGIHFHAGAYFIFNPESRFNTQGELKESVKKFVGEYWNDQRKGRKRYSFTVDIIAHAACDGKSRLDFCGEVKFHKNWRGKLSLKPTESDLQKLSKLKECRVCTDVAMIQVAAEAGRVELDELTGRYREKVGIFTKYV